MEKFILEMKFHKKLWNSDNLNMYTTRCSEKTELIGIFGYSAPSEGVQTLRQMAYEEETEYFTSLYRCLDPIENLRIKIVLKPVKNLLIPLPQFNGDHSSLEISISQDVNQSDVEEYTFKWQEKIFSKNEITKFSSQSEWKEKINEKHHNSFMSALNSMKTYPKKIFSYVEDDNYSVGEKVLENFRDRSTYVSYLSKRMNQMKVSGQNNKHKNTAKRKVINYCPTNEFKNKSHIISKNNHKMFIMADLSSAIRGSKKKEKEEKYEFVLCSLNYDSSNKILEITPSFSKGELKPYVINMGNEYARDSFYYWIHHASTDISIKNLNEENKIMRKVFDHQEELRKLQIGTEFLTGKPNHFYVTLLGEIKTAQDFEYDHLFVHYFLSLPSNWGCDDLESLIGTTPTCQQNCQGIAHFSHLFEITFYSELTSLEDSLCTAPEIFFEVLSVDKYNRYRIEGYTYVSVPKNPGIHILNLNCWRPLDKTIKSQLERYFIGGGPELDDVSYVGLTSTDKAEVTSRFGLETVPTGRIDVKLSILHQSEIFKAEKGDKLESGKNILDRLDTGSLLGSVNAVLEVFRRARQRMLEAKKGLEIESNDLNSEFKNQLRKIEEKQQLELSNN